MPQSNYGLVWPYRGDFITMAAGVVQVNFVTGEVERETGNRDKMSASLQALGFEAIRSILIETDQTISVQFDGGFRYQVNASDIYRIPNVWLKSLTITATRTSFIRVWGSTDPDGVPERFASSIVAGKVVAQTTSSGLPFVRAGRGSATGSYTNIASYTVPAGSQGNLREVAFDATEIGSVSWKLIIASQQNFRGLTLNNAYAAPFPDCTLGPGTVVRIQAVQIGSSGSYIAVAGISGKNY